MTFLSAVTHGIQERPVRFVLVGHPGVGKTQLAASMPSPIFQSTEDGLGLIDAPSFPSPQSFEEALAQVHELISGEHAYKTLVVDAVDGIEPLIYKSICEAGGKSAIADFGYNKGYVAADVMWVEYLKALDALRAARNMNVALISHAAAVNYDDPILGTYSRFEPNLHKRVVPILCKWADLLGFLDIERAIVEKGKDKKVTTSRTSGARFLHLTDTGSFIAKNRYGLPPKLEIPEANGWQTISTALRAAFADAKSAAEATAATK